RHLREGYRAQRRHDPLANLPQGIADAALAVLLTVAVLRRAGRHRQRTVDRLDHIRHRDGRRGAAQRVAAARTLLRSRHARAHETLENLRQELGWDVVARGNLARAARGAIALLSEVLHRNQRVIGFLGQPQHSALLNTTTEVLV